MPEEVKQLFRADNLKQRRNMRISFYDFTEVLYPSEDLFPDEKLYPADLGTPFLVIEDDQILSETLRLSESLCPDNDIQYGACEAVRLEFECAGIYLDLAGKEFTLSIEIDGYDFFMGIYRAESVEKTADTEFKKVVAYDRMRMFDTNVTIWYNEFFSDNQQHTLKEFRNSLCDYIGITQEQQDLIQDDMLVEKTVEEELMGREVLRCICEINGVFGHFSRTGELRYISLHQTGLYPSEDLFPADDLYPANSEGFEEIDVYQNIDFEEYITPGIDKLRIRMEEGDIGAIVGSGNNGYTIEGNFLVYGKDSAALNEIAQKIYDHIGEMSYQPYNATTLGLPWLEVGDGVRIYTYDEMNIIESFMLTRELSGVQAMTESIGATGNQEREEITGTNKEIIRLKGKTATIKKQVDEVSVDLKDFETETEAQFKITSEQITQEVIRAKGSEEELSGRITVNAGKIELKVSKGEVSAQISIEKDLVEIVGNRFVLNSSNCKISKEGTLECVNGKFSGAITSSTINIGNGNFVLGSDGIPKLRNADIGGVLNGVTINGANLVTGVDIVARNNLTANHCYFEYVDINEIRTCRRMYCDDIYLTGNWWAGWSLTEEIRLLHNAVFGGS